MSTGLPLDELRQRAAEATTICAVIVRMLGDAVICTPTLDAVRRWKPDARLTVVLSARIAPLFEGHPSIDDILVVRDRPYWQHKFATMRAMKKRRFDLVLNLHGGPTSGWYAWGSKGLRVGMTGYSMAAIHHHLADPMEHWPGRRPEDARVEPGDGRGEPLHKAEVRFTVARAAGVPGDPGPLTIPIPDAAHEAAQARMREHGLPDRGFVIVQPTATRAPKQWDTARFATVCEHLAKQGLQVVVTTGPREQADFAKLRAIAPPGLDLQHHHSVPLPEFAALASRARMYLGNDTGPAHISAAAGCPCVTIFGPIMPGTWRPWGVPYRAVSVHAWCSPCSFKRECPRGEGPHPHCIANVTTDMVIAAVDGLLAETEKA